MATISPASAWAEPLDNPDQRAELLASDLPSPGEQPVDTLTWLQQEAQLSLLDAHLDQDREAVVRHAWQAPHPTWIQGSATVNLGDFPNLDDPTARAEQQLKTLEWVIEEQRRIAAGQPRRDAEDGGDDGADPDNWLRKLMPRHWIAKLKANREWVAAGGTALLVMVWATAAFSRRSGAGHPASKVAAAPEPARRLRRRRHSHPGSATHGARLR